MKLKFNTKLEGNQLVVDTKSPSFKEAIVDFIDSFDTDDNLITVTEESD